MRFPLKNFLTSFQLFFFLQKQTHIASSHFLTRYISPHILSTPPSTSRVPRTFLPPLKISKVKYITLVPKSIIHTQLFSIHRRHERHPLTNDKLILQKHRNWPICQDACGKQMVPFFLVNESRFFCLVHPCYAAGWPPSHAEAGR